jgi:hypothetical protein
MKTCKVYGSEIGNSIGYFRTFNVSGRGHVYSLIIFRKSHAVSAALRSVAELVIKVL